MFKIYCSKDIILWFLEKNNWSICPAGIRLKDGNYVQAFSPSGGKWDSENHLYTDAQFSLNIILDPSQIVGMYFYSGYELNEQRYRVLKPFNYIPLNVDFFLKQVKMFVDEK